MQLGPVIEIIEIDRIENRAVIAQAGGGKNTTACLVIVVVTADGGIGSVNFALGDRAAALLLNPALKRNVAGFVVLDIGDGGVAVDAEAVENHLVESGATLRIAVFELAGGAQAQFRPQTRQVDFLIVVL